MSEENFKVSEEAAEAEFQRFVDAMDLNFDPKGWDAEEKKSFVDSKIVFIDAIRRGFLIVDEAGQPVYTPKLEPRTPITFYEPDGACIMSMDLVKKGRDNEKGFQLLTTMTKAIPGTFAKMKQRDLKVCQAVAGLFLGSR